MIDKLHLSPEIAARVARQAELDGVLVEQWIYEALKTKLDTAEFFLRRQNAKGGTTLSDFLDRASNPPDPGDELPEGWTAT